MLHNKQAITVKAAQLPTHERFRVQFVNNYVQKTHATRYDNNRSASNIKHLCVCDEVKAILLEESINHHNIGRKKDDNQIYGTYKHMQLIDAACVGANVPKYSHLQTQIQSLQSQYQQHIQAINIQNSQLKQQIKQQCESVINQYKQQCETKLNSLNSNLQKYKQNYDQSQSLLNQTQSQLKQSQSKLYQSQKAYTQLQQQFDNCQSTLKITTATANLHYQY